MIYTDGVHLVVDGLEEELHRFARSVGLKREWFQEQPDHPHYDITTRRMLRKILDTNMVTRVSRKELVNKILKEKNKMANKCRFADSCTLYSKGPGMCNVHSLRLTMGSKGGKVYICSRYRWLEAEEKVMQKTILKIGNWIEENTEEMSYYHEPGSPYDVIRVDDLKAFLGDLIREEEAIK